MHLIVRTPKDAVKLQHLLDVKVSWVQLHYAVISQNVDLSASSDCQVPDQRVPFVGYICSNVFQMYFFAQTLNLAPILPNRKKSSIPDSLRELRDGADIHWLEKGLGHEVTCPICTHGVFELE